MKVDNDYQSSVSEDEEDGFQVLGKVLSYVCTPGGNYTNIEWYLMGKQFGNMVILKVDGSKGQLYDVTHVGSRRIQVFDSGVKDEIIVEVDSMFTIADVAKMYFKKPF